MPEDFWVVPDVNSFADHYKFDKDKLIIALHLLDKLRALDFSEKEIAHIIVEYSGWNPWNPQSASYPHLEQFINEEAQSRGLDSEDLEDLTMNYKIKKRVDFNQVYEKIVSFVKEKQKPSS